jgi:hypothetical protein
MGIPYLNGYLLIGVESGSHEQDRLVLIKPDFRGKLENAA